MAHLIKDKEILINKNKQRMFHIKIALKVQKNKIYIKYRFSIGL